jgi:3-dehydroquinate synthase
MTALFNTQTVTLEELRTILSRDYSESQCFMLVDENTKKHCLPHLFSLHRLLEIPPSIQNARILEISSGEKNKNLGTFTWIIEQLNENQADKKSLLINVGGGMVCDIGGFAASCYKRGIDFVNIPTTLLAMIDAAHGGKTGINFRNFKNQIGVFAPAKMVAIDTRLLNTLPDDQVLSGFAEMIKIALITSVDFWTAVKQIDLNNLNSAEPLILQTIERKTQIVEEDPNEKNVRKILNFGHTFGHAFETFALENKRELLHGYAVAMGILCELWLSEKVLNFDTVQRREISDFILSKYPKFRIQATDFKRLIEILQQDKKNNNGDIKPILLEKIGHPQYDLTCSKDLCLQALQAYSNL